MKIKSIFQLPTGTVVCSTQDLPSRIVGGYLQVEGQIYKIKGVPTDDKQSMLIEKTEALKVGQELVFLTELQPA